MNLDLSKFRKVEAGDKHTILLHDNGHELKVAHRGLSDKFRKQLEEMPTNLAKGGHAKFSQKYDPNMGSKPSKPSKADNPMPDMNIGREARNTYSEPDEQGGNDIVLKSLNRQAPPYGAMGSEQQHYPPCINPSCKSFGKPHPNCRCYGGNPEGKESHNFADGGEVKKEYYCDNNRTHFKGCEYFKDGGDVESEGDKLEKVKQDINSEMQDQTPMDSPLTSTPAPSPLPAPGQVNPNPEMSSQPDQLNAPDQAQPQVPQQTPDQTQRAPSSSEDTQMPPAEVFQKYKADHMQQMLNESSQFNSELNSGQVTPQHYFHLFGRDDTLGKIGTAFGLMLSGIGSGLTHQPNAALQIMQNEINNDLNAQQKSVENKQNFLKINQQGLLNQTQEAQMSQETKVKAWNLAKMQMNMAALHSLVQHAQTLPPGSPQRQQADQQLAMLNQGVQNENFNIADRAATAAALGTYLGGGQGRNTKLMKSGLLGPEAKEVGEDVESKTIPGVGEGTLPVPQHVRDQVQAMKTLSDKASDLMQYSGKNFATLSPAKRAVAQQKASEMVNFYNNSIQGGVLTEGRLGWLDDQIKKNPTGIVTQLMGNQQRLNEIKQSNDHRMNLMLQQYGVPVKKESQGSGQTKVVNGVTYKRGPNGEAIKVK